MKKRKKDIIRIKKLRFEFKTVYMQKKTLIIIGVKWTISITSHGLCLKTYRKNSI